MKFIIESCGNINQHNSPVDLGGTVNFNNELAEKQEFGVRNFWSLTYSDFLSVLVFREVLNLTFVLANYTCISRFLSINRLA